MFLREEQARCKYVGILLRFRFFCTVSDFFMGEDIPGNEVKQFMGKIEASSPRSIAGVHEDTDTQRIIHYARAGYVFA